MSDSYVSWEPNLYIHVWNHASISTFVLVLSLLLRTSNEPIRAKQMSRSFSVNDLHVSEVLSKLITAGLLILNVYILKTQLFNNKKN